MKSIKRVTATVLVVLMVALLPCVSLADTILSQVRNIAGGYYNTTSKVNFSHTRKGRANLDASFISGSLPDVVAGYAGYKFVNSYGNEFGILIKTDFYQDVIETGALNPISVSVSQKDTSGDAVSAKGHYSLIGTTWDLPFN